MKLKTLKDLEKAVHKGDVMKFLQEENEVGADWMCSVVLAGDLKQEAIKLIKSERFQTFKLNGKTIMITQNARDLVKYLNNITEDDLK